ncbi:Conserved_hypothetical protein [Hexamita inflata]|uniref:Uncharacterized protein n=1 Tax=Hexamita inflata TaxID=28002 RepID=A0AA86NA67_9EUKA|nr:Conserved hypothetical protein [Hexamita inflata]
MEQCEYLIIGDGLVELMTGAFLNMLGHRTLVLKSRTIIHADSKITVAHKPNYDSSDQLSFNKLRATFDPNQVPYYASSLFVDIVFSAQLSHYLTLEKTGQVQILSKSSLTSLPTDKQQLLQTQLSPILKRNILKFIMSLHQITSLIQPGFLVSTKQQEGTVVLNQLEESILSEKMNLNQVLEKLNLTELKEEIKLTFCFQEGERLEQMAQKFGTYTASKQKFDNCGCFIINQYGGSDVHQCFERLNFVYGGFVLTDDCTIENKVCTCQGINIEFKEIIQFEHQEYKKEYYLAVIEDTPEKRAQFNLEESKNQIILSDKCKCIVRLGAGQQLSKGCISLEFYEYENEQEINKFMETLNITPAKHQTFSFAHTENQIIPFENNTVMKAVSTDFDTCLSSAEDCLIKLGIKTEKVIKEQMTILERQNAVDSMFSRRGQDVEIVE